MDVGYDLGTLLNHLYLWMQLDWLIGAFALQTQEL